MDEKKRRHIGPYELGRTLGEGAFGKVKLGTNIFTGEKVAVKIISNKNIKNNREKHQVQREREILLRLKHPNIVNLLKVVDDEKREKTFMIFEYVAGGELFDYIVAHGRLTERDARRFMRQARRIISAVEYCHSLLIVHRDLKPENLLLDSQLNIKISDFGLSNIMEPGKKFNTFCGSLHYACPEILRGEQYLGPGVDIWSMGIVLYCLVVGRQPWDGANAEELIHGILEEGLEVPQGITDDCVNLILSMLRVSEEDRISIAEMRYHPWIMDGFDAPPESYLPPIEAVRHIDEDVIDQLRAMGFLLSHEDPAEELRSADRTQLVVTYNLLVTQKQERLKEAEEREAKLEQERILAAKEEAEKREKQKREDRAKGKASAVAIGEHQKRKSSSNGKKARKSEEGDKVRKSSSAKMDRRKGALPPKAEAATTGNARSRSRSIATSAPTPMLPPAFSNPTTPQPPQAHSAARSRAASVTTGPARPVFSIEARAEFCISILTPQDIKSGKVKAPAAKDKKKGLPSASPAKKPSATKEARPSIVGSDLFQPPSPAPAPAPTLSDAGVSPTIAETTSTKPAADILADLKKVLSGLNVKFRDRKAPFTIKCSAVSEGESVRFVCEIVNVVKNTDLRGVAIKRISGDIWAYKTLYSAIVEALKKEKK